MGRHKGKRAARIGITAQWRLTLLFPEPLIISSLAISDFFKFLEAITTLAPSLANSKAADFPIPVFPPVRRTAIKILDPGYYKTVIYNHSKNLRKSRRATKLK